MHHCSEARSGTGRTSQLSGRVGVWHGLGGIAREGAGKALGPDELSVPNQGAKVLHRG